MSTSSKLSKRVQCKRIRGLFFFLLLKASNFLLIFLVCSNNASKCILSASKGFLSGLDGIESVVVTGSFARIVTAPMVLLRFFATRPLCRPRNRFTNPSYVAMSLRRYVAASLPSLSLSLSLSLSPSLSFRLS